MTASIGVFLAIVVLILTWWRLRPNRVAATGLGLFAGGAAANTTERLVFGAVTDYLPVSWPYECFVNIADLSIVTGVVVLAATCVTRYRLFDLNVRSLFEGLRIFQRWSE